MREKVRFGKRYYQNEQGEWIYLADTMAEAEYRDKVQETVSGVKAFIVFSVLTAAAVYLAMFRPDLLEGIENSPVFIGIAVAVAIIGVLFIALFVIVPLIMVLPELVKAYRRDILGQDVE